MPNELPVVPKHCWRSRRKQHNPHIWHVLGAIPQKPTNLLVHLQFETVNSFVDGPTSVAVVGYNAVYCVESHTSRLSRHRQQHHVSISSNKGKPPYDKSVQTIQHEPASSDTQQDRFQQPRVTTCAAWRQPRPPHTTIRQRQDCHSRRREGLAFSSVSPAAHPTHIKLKYCYLEG